MEITILSVGKVASPWIAKGIEEFEKRLSRYIKFSSKLIPDIRNSKALTKDLIKIEEGKNLLTEINPSDFVILLDERGKEFSSQSFSHWIEKQLSSGKKRIVFVIGGPFGFSEAIYQRSDSQLSLSKMTFTHEMAKLFFTEQIYRAFTILNNEPYHHD